MRIRTVKPEFFTHEGLFDLESSTGLPVRLAFAGLWCAADREGRFKWEPRRLGVQILPYDNVDFSRVLHALATRGFIRKYASGTGVFGVIPSFLTHQVINNREKDSEIPEPLEYMDCDASGTREARVGHAGKAEGKGREGNMEGKGRDFDASGTRAGVDGFDEFWKAYPRKIGKGNALKAWTKNRPPLDRVLETLAWQSASREWTKDGGQFIPHPATWLNRAGWEDQQTIIRREDDQIAF
jgi:hypothetical protein